MSNTDAMLLSPSMARAPPSTVFLRSAVALATDSLDMRNSWQREQEKLLREYDKEASESGTGISGRIAKAAGSAFDRIFGSEKEKEQDKKDTDDELEHGKTAAQ